MIVLYTTERDYPWGTLRSTHASKTKVVLEEKALAYRIENLSPGNLWKKPPEMLARHPLGKVPWIEDDGLPIFDSTVINEYLEERYPEPPLLPKDPVARMRAREAEQFGDEALLSGSVPPIWMPYWSEPAKRDTARMEQGRELLRSRDLPYLERLLGGAPAGGYLCGQFTVADIPVMALAMVLDVDQMKLDAFPMVGAYLKRLRERPSYRAISPHTKVADANERA
ncbi:MAG TPA: glutathione S-transferase family protein [Candidatus Binataceae bacterium]|nr:glutathione S-transferase family protein [Candidatus Binataceae bacterium]